MTQTKLRSLRISDDDWAALAAKATAYAQGDGDDNVTALMRKVARGELLLSEPPDNSLLWQLVEAGAASVQAAASAEVAAEYADYVSEAVGQGHKPAAFAEWYGVRRNGKKEKGE